MMAADCGKSSHMEMSIREAKTRFCEAIAAVMRGERVAITRDGLAVAELPQVTTAKQ